MDKKIAGLLGGVAALTALGTAQAATPQSIAPGDGLRASSYADLLAPIPNAVAALQKDDAARDVKAASGMVRVAEDHHHHHHHRYHKRVIVVKPHRHHRHHHHHHHHHDETFLGVTVDQ
jgi:hypothetical protein